MAPRLVRAALVAALAGVLGTPAAAAWAGPGAATAARPPVAVTAATGTDDAAGAGESEPTPEEVLAEQRRAAALLKEVADRTDDLEAAEGRLDTLARAAALALEQYTSAVLAERQARLDADRQDDLLLQSQLRLAAQKAVLGRWAREAYGAGDLAVNPALGTILGGGTTDDLGRALTYLDRVGSSKSRAVDEYAAAVRAQADAAAAAEAARIRARSAADAARLARETADRAVEAQRGEVADLQDRLEEAQDAAELADTRARNLARAGAIASARSGDGNVVTGAVGDCRGGDTSLYRNGNIPVSVLCPLWGTSNHHLRADAAYAFNRLSRAYAQRYGEPICVTDSYRDYATQVRLYAEKPHLAAVPGTSNHGWGTATDLCGGIQNFGTSTHNWMLMNAPAYGWFHPSWAEPSGSRPEPWHWEFAG